MVRRLSPPALVLFVLGLCVLPSALPADDETLTALTSITGQGMTNGRAYKFLEELCDQIGGRVTGSFQAQQATAWGVEKMNAMGLTNVHLEKWELSAGWKRIAADAEMVAPIHRRLSIASMGWVGSVASGPAEAEVIAVNLNQLEHEMKDNASRWTGKVLITVHQGETPQIPPAAQLGAFLETAYAAHAVAVITGQDGLEAEGMSLAHTGRILASRIFHNIPVVSMVMEDEKQIRRFLDRGKPVRVKIDVQNVLSGPTESANVVGEIRGWEHPEQVVVVSAHLDSWDLAQGATDDGFGVAATLGAAEAVLASGRMPRRTLRFVLFTGEEQGELGSQAYVNDHRNELKDHVAALILDSGQGPVDRLSVGGHSDLIPAMRSLATLAAAFGPIAVDDNVSLSTDCAPFIVAGLPGINIGQNSPEYRFTHHTSADTLDKVNPDFLMRDATVMALTAFWIADRPDRLATPWPAGQTARMLVEKKQDFRLKVFGLWPFGDPSQDGPKE